jgi:glutathione-independent formaldehyde dehydrogenase
MKSQNASTTTTRPGAERLTPLSFSDDITLTNQFPLRRTAFMASNRGLAYLGPGKVEVQSIDFPKLALGSRKCEHGVILKIVSTNICGSDQHMVRGRTTAPQGLILGHEITGEVIEAGRDVEFVKIGDLVSVPFNIACGRCRNCKDGKTGICLHVNPARSGAAYGYVDMGGGSEGRRST